jgi:hypothetical protein
MGWPKRVRPEAGQPHRAGATGTPDRPDDRLRETHRLQLRHDRAVTNYRRNFICGGSFFFTANPAERRLRLPVDDIVPAKDDGFRCRSTHPAGCKSATETDEAADQHNR